MNRSASLLLQAGALLFAATMFLPEAVTAWRSGSRRGGVPRPEYFHGGKTAVEVPPTGGCLDEKCHRTPAHPRRRPESAFLNMHEPLVPCLGCHGIDPERHWSVPDPSGDQRTYRVAYSRVRGDGRDPHEGTAVPARCPRCHSGGGREALAKAGVKGLADGFESPIALRMLEGAGRKWLTEDIR